MTSETKRHRNYCFTLNNYTEQEVKNIEKSKCSYIIYGYEVGEEGTPHLQGYVEYTNQKRFNEVKKDLGSDRYHLEPRKGTQKQAIEYCKKEAENIYEKGEIKKQGKRSDIDALHETLQNTNDILEIADTHFEMFLKYNKAIKDYLNLKLEKKATERRLNLKVHTIIGAPGIGKTRYVMDKHGDDKVYKIEFKDNNIWFDGYNGQEVLLIDEYEGQLNYTQLLNLLDIYKLRLPVKGGFTYALWTTVYITSNIPLNEWYRRNTDALERRIHENIIL